MDTWIWIVIVGVVVLALVGMAVAASRSRSRRRALHERFGDEYDRTVDATDSRRAGERDLRRAKPNTTNWIYGRSVTLPGSGTRVSGRNSRRDSLTGRGRRSSKPTIS